MITQTLEKFSKHAIASLGREPDGAVKLIVLRDGRRLAYQEFGDRRGFPLFYCHSHGSSRLEAMLFDTAARRAGFRLVSIDRPGTGYSDFKSGGDAGAFAADVLELADSLGCRKFGVMALGGGAVYALALCQLAPQRAQLMLGLSSIPPRPLSILRNSSGIIARTMAVLMRLHIGIRHRLFARNPLHYLDRLRETLCFSDRRMLQNAQVLEMLHRDVEESMRQGARGVAHDISQSLAGWGFDPHSVMVPVHLWQGSADTLVSRHCVEEFARTIPHSRLHRVANRGHFFFLRGMDEVFAVANSELSGGLERRNNLIPMRTGNGTESIPIRAVV